MLQFDTYMEHSCLIVNILHRDIIVFVFDVNEPCHGILMAICLTSHGMHNTNTMELNSPRISMVNQGATMQSGYPYQAGPI